MISVIPCCRVLDYLNDIQGKLKNPSGVGSGLRPSEVRLPSGCIEEIDANYKGDLVSGVLTSVQSGDTCCQKCQCAFFPASFLSWESSIYCPSGSHFLHVSCCDMCSLHTEQGC